MIFSLNGNNWNVMGFYKNQWRFASSDTDLLPTIARIPATVPGSVQADLLAAGMLEDFNVGLNSNHDEWVNNREWFFDLDFIVPEDSHHKYILCFDGLDYHGEIHLNGKKVKQFSGMFLPVEIDITGLVNRDANHLRVIFYLTPEVEGQIGYSNQIKLFKSRFNYVWDWCPRIIPVGIWDDVYIKAYDFTRITGFFPKSSVDIDRHVGNINVSLELESLCPGRYEIEIEAIRDNTVYASTVFSEMLPAAKKLLQYSIPVENVELWWPNGRGNQPLYDVSVSVKTSEGFLCDKASKSVGFRNVEFVQNPSSSQDALPYTAVVNGQRMFLRGIDWVPISPLYGSVTKEQYMNLLTRFRDMNCNILRVWGGAILEKKDFYDICDKMGLMVWQEFPQSSSGLNNTPPDDPEVLEELRIVAEVFIRRRKHHACHIIWCGGNELTYEDTVPIDSHHINIKMLKALVDEMDKDKYFLPTSSSGPKFSASEENFGKELHHDVHGPWTFTGEPSHYRYFNGDDSLFRSETGCPGASRMETLERYKGIFEVWPPDNTNPYWVHRGAWWLQMTQLTALFGYWDVNGSNSVQYIKASRYLQAEALRYAIEATRRREPISSGFIIWMGNEPYPNNANTSIVEYDGTPKPAYYWVKNAFSGLHCSARFEKIRHAVGERFDCGIYLHSDSILRKSVTIEARILNVAGEVFSELHWTETPLMPATFVGTIGFDITSCPSDVFILDLTVSTDGITADRNTYLFTVTEQPAFEPLRHLPPCTLKMTKTGDCMTFSSFIIENTSCMAAVGVFLFGNDSDNFISFSDNYFFLLPGETKSIEASSLRGMVDVVDFIIEAMNDGLIIEP
jgi:beta-mannosidase